MFEEAVEIARAVEQNQTPLDGNVNSLHSIISDITMQIKYQILGNVSVLKNNHPNLASEIDTLMSGPIKQALGRLNGLNKVVSQIRKQVSTGNSTKEN